MARPIPGACSGSRLRTSTATFVAAAAGILFLGCSPHRAGTLRVGLNSWPGYEFLYLAQEKGYFREEEVDVRIVEFMSLSDARAPTNAGRSTPSARQ